MTARVCSTPGCPRLLPQGAGQPKSGKCTDCRANADRKRRPHGNPYASPGHRAFRAAVLKRDPVCVACHAAPSTVADHHPMERVELIDAGSDPNDPRHGQGLCKSCHDTKTSTTFRFTKYR